MKNQFTRNEYVIGKENQKRINESSVLVLGVGGVGSHSAESLVRCGIGTIILIDNDVFDITNINRQLPATHNTIGKSKVNTLKERLLMINPDCNVITHETFIEKDNLEIIFKEKPDYIIDAIDSIQSKYDFIKACIRRKQKFISCMGTGNKLDPTRFRISDISKTSYDPIARIIRNRLKKENINAKVPVVWSDEEPISSTQIVKDGEKKVPGSISFLPSVSGYIAASYVIRKIIGVKIK